MLQFKIINIHHQKQPSKSVLNKVVLKIYSIFTGDHLCGSVISIIHCIFSKIIFLRTPLGNCFWIMSDQSNSTCSNTLLENIDSDIPIALGFTTPPKIPETKKKPSATQIFNQKEFINYFRYWKINLWKVLYNKIKTRTVM